MTLAEDSTDAQKWCYRLPHFTHPLHHDSSTIWRAGEDILSSLFCPCRLGRNTGQYGTLSHRWARLVPLWAVPSKTQQSNSPLPPAEWDGFRNSFISGPPFFSDSSHIPSRLRALCWTWVYIQFLSLFWNSNRYFHWESFACGEQVLMPRVHVLLGALSWKLHVLNVCRSTVGKCRASPCLRVWPVFPPFLSSFAWQWVSSLAV